MSSRYEIDIILKAEDKTAAALKAMQERINKMNRSKDSFANKQNTDEYNATLKHMRNLARLRARFASRDLISQEVNPATRRQMRDNEAEFQASKSTFQRLNDLKRKQEEDAKQQALKQKANELKIEADVSKAREKAYSKKFAQQEKNYIKAFRENQKQFEKGRKDYIRNIQTDLQLRARTLVAQARIELRKRQQESKNNKKPPINPNSFMNRVRGLFGLAPVQSGKLLGSLRTSTMFTAASGARARLMASGLIAIALALGDVVLKFRTVYEYSQVAFTNIMNGSDAATKHMTTLENMTNKTGVSFEGLVSASLLMQNLGYSTQQSNEQLQLFADTAASMGKTGDDAATSVNAMAQAFGRMHTLGLVSLGDIQAIEAQAPGTEQALAKMRGTSVRGLEAVLSRGAVRSPEMEAQLNQILSKNKGMAAKQQTTFGGSLSGALSRSLQGASDRMAPFAMVLGKVLQMHNEAADYVGGLFSGSGDETTKGAMIPGGKSFKGKALKQSSPSIIQAAWAKMFDYVSRHTTDLQQTLNKSWDYIKKHASTYWTQIQKFLEDTWNGFVTDLANDWKQIQDDINTAWTAIKDWFNANIYDPIIQPIIDNFNSLMASLNSIWDSIYTWATTTWYNIYNYVAPLVNNLVSAIEGPISTVGSFLSGIWNDIYTFATNTWYNIYNYVAPLVSNLVNSITSTLDSGRNTINNLWQMISDWATSTWDNIYNYISPTVNNLVSTVSNLINSLWSTLAGIWDDISNYAYGAWSDLHDSVYEAALNTYDDVTGIITNLWTTLQGLWASITLDAQNAWKAITDLYNQITGQATQVPPAPNVNSNAQNGLTSNSVNIPSSAQSQVTYKFDFSNAQVFGINDLESMVTQAINNAQRRGRLA